MQVRVAGAQRGQTIPKYQEFGTEKPLLRALQGDSGSCMKNSKLSKSFQQTLFLQKRRQRHGQLLQNSQCQSLCSWGQVMVRKGCSCKSLPVQSNWVTQPCLLFATSCCICCTPGFPVFHYLPEFAQTHVHCVGDAIQPTNPLLTPSPPAFNLSQHHSLFQWVGSHHVAKVLEFQFQHQSFQWVFRTDFL